MLMLQITMEEETHKITEEMTADEIVTERFDGSNAADEVAMITAVLDPEVARDVDDRPRTIAITTDPSPSPKPFTKIEKSLASLGFFTPSSRRLKDQKIKRMNFTREIDGKRVEVSADIVPSAMFGLPITADQDKYLALQKIITNILQAEGKVSNPIRFSSAELLRLLGRSRAGRNYREINEWLDVMTTTTIMSEGVVYRAGEKRFAKDRFHVFDRAVSFGKELDGGVVADANYVWLSAWQLENINHHFLLPIDDETYRELKNHIAKALVPLLQVWLFASHRAGSFEKRYEELCDMLMLQKYKSPSQIVRQLKPSLDELAHHQYLETWSIEKTVDRKSYKVVLFHGPKFHQDRRKRLEQKHHAEAPVVVARLAPTEPGLPTPGKLESQVVPTKGEELVKIPPTDSGTVDALQPDATAIPPELIDELSARGVLPSVAIKLLRSVPGERLSQVTDYIAFWDTAQKTGDVRPGLLYDLIRSGDPLPANFETRAQRDLREAGERRQRNQKAVATAMDARYGQYKTTTVDRVISEEIGEAEFERRVAEHVARASEGVGESRWALSPDLADMTARRAIRAKIGEAHALPFDEFSKRELPLVLDELHIDPSDLGPEPATAASAEDAIAS